LSEQVIDYRDIWQFKWVENWKIRDRPDYDAMLKLLVTEGVGLQIQVADDIFREHLYL
jgi:hypothetical protein